MLQSEGRCYGGQEQVLTAHFEVFVLEKTCLSKLKDNFFKQNHKVFQTSLELVQSIFSACMALWVPE